MLSEASCAAANGVSTMPDTADWQAKSPLQLLDELIRERPAIAGDVAKINDDIWAIHGVIPVDGNVILAEFGSYEEARSALDQLPVASHERLLSAAPASSAAAKLVGSA